MLLRLKLSMRYVFIRPPCFPGLMGTWCIRLRLQVFPSLALLFALVLADLLLAVPLLLSLRCNVLKDLIKTPVVWYLSAPPRPPPPSSL